MVEKRPTMSVEYSHSSSESEEEDEIIGKDDGKKNKQTP